MEKSVVKSRSIRSGFIALISAIAMGIVGRHNPEIVALAVSNALGAIGAIYYRYKARHKLVLKEKKIV